MLDYTAEDDFHEILADYINHITSCSGYVADINHKRPCPPYCGHSICEIVELYYTW